MTLTIELGSDQEARLLQEAARHGMDADEYVRRLIELYVLPQTLSFNGPATPEARAREYRAWAAGHRSDGPLLSDEAVSRESMYGERG